MVIQSKPSELLRFAVHTPEGLSQPLAVAMLSKADATGGGASRVAEILSGGLRDLGHPARHYCRYATAGFNAWRKPLAGRDNLLLAHRLAKFRQKFGLAEVLPFELAALRREFRRLPPALLHFHDISSAFSPLTLAALGRELPVIWTLHDCSPFTGGCLYPMGCEKFTRRPGCMGCPQSGTWPIDTPWDSAWLNHRLRRALHASGRVRLVAPSRWMAAQAERSGMVRGGITVIPNGIDGAPFLRANRQRARQKLGIDRGRLVFSLSAGNLSDSRKNVQEAVRVLSRTTQRDFTVILIGHDTEIEFNRSDVQVIRTGYVQCRDSLADHLAASDIQLFTSRADNHPLSVLEVMASGSVVIGYATGGVPEQVVDGETGILVPTNDIGGLQAVVDGDLSRDRLRAMGEAARARFRHLFTAERMVADHLALYQQVLA